MKMKFQMIILLLASVIGCQTQTGQPPAVSPTPQPISQPPAVSPVSQEVSQPINYITTNWGASFGRLKLEPYKFGANTPQPSFKVFGSDFINMFFIQIQDNKMHLSSDIPDIDGKIAFKGAVWSSTDTRSGYIWTPRVEKIADVDLGSDHKISESPAFDFDAFRQNPNVINFSNGYGVNLYGAIMENGVIIQAGTVLTYTDSKGRALRGRLIQKQIENGRQVLSEKFY